MLQRYHASLTWRQRYRVREFARKSLWTLPVLGVVAAFGAYWPLHGIESLMGWELQVNDAEDRAMAELSDSQGVGGKQAKNQGDT